MNEKQTVIDSVLSRSPSAVEVLGRLLELAQDCKLELVNVEEKDTYELLSDHLTAEYVRTGQKEITLTLKYTESGEK